MTKIEHFTLLHVLVSKCHPWLVQPFIHLDQNAFCVHRNFYVVNKSVVPGSSHGSSSYTDELICFC